MNKMYHFTKHRPSSMLKSMKMTAKSLELEGIEPTLGTPMKL